jgi:hypothetical protein
MGRWLKNPTAAIANGKLFKDEYGFSQNKIWL